MALLPSTLGKADVVLRRSRACLFRRPRACLLAHKKWFLLPEVAMIVNLPIDKDCCGQPPFGECVLTSL